MQSDTAAQSGSTHGAVCVRRHPTVKLLSTLPLPPLPVLSAVVSIGNLVHSPSYTPPRGTPFYAHTSATFGSAADVVVWVSCRAFHALMCLYFFTEVHTTCGSYSSAAATQQLCGRGLKALKMLMKTALAERALHDTRWKSGVTATVVKCDFP